MPTNDQLVYFDNAGIGPLVPALCVGVNATTLQDAFPTAVSYFGFKQDAAAVARRHGLETSVFDVGVQGGGGACICGSALGFLLRLETNAKSAKQPVADLVRVFHAMAEPSDTAFLNRFDPALVSLCQTQGDDYDDATLQRLTRLLTTYFRLPEVVWGIEAWVEFDEAAVPYDVVDGWKTLSVEPGVIALEEPVAPKSFHEREAFGPSHRACLDEIVGLLPLVAAPSLSLIWENSD